MNKTRSELEVTVARRVHRAFLAIATQESGSFLFRCCHLGAPRPPAVPITGSHLRTTLTRLLTAQALRTSSMSGSLLSGAASLYGNEAFTDLKIFCEDTTFKVHKLVVCPKSPVLKRVCEERHEVSGSPTK